MKSQNKQFIGVNPVRRMTPFLALVFCLIPQLSFALTEVEIIKALNNDKERAVFVNHPEWSHSYFTFLFSQPSEVFNSMIDSDYVFLEYREPKNKNLLTKYYERFSENMEKQLKDKPYDKGMVNRYITRIIDYLEADPELAIEALIKTGLRSKDYKTANIFLTAVQRAAVSPKAMNESAFNELLQEKLLRDYNDVAKAMEAEEKGPSLSDSDYHFKKQREYHNYMAMNQPECLPQPRKQSSLEKVVQKAKTALYGDELQRSEKEMPEALKQADIATEKLHRKFGSQFEALRLLSNRAERAVDQVFVSLGSTNPASFYKNWQILADFKIEAENSIEEAKKIAKEIEDHAVISLKTKGYTELTAYKAAKSVSKEANTTLHELVKKKVTPLQELTNHLHFIEYIFKLRSKGAGPYHYLKFLFWPEDVTPPKAQAELDALRLGYDRELEEQGGDGIRRHNIKRTLIDMLGVTDRAPASRIFQGYTEALERLNSDPIISGRNKKLRDLKSAMENYIRIYGDPAPHQDGEQAAPQQDDKEQSAPQQ